ncbi:MAG: NADH-quinone oxidoreductase subunit A [Alphaproteobacteria bacterium]|nr:NADH-quinone oxidoreductase subunit A [Alphaproteobacteria bacterium]
MTDLLITYLPILMFIAIAGILGIVLMGLPMIIAPSQPDPEKLSAYECGFNAFEDARMKFDVRFYLVSILFIVVDLDLMFLFPFAVAYLDLPREEALFAFWSMMVFLGVFFIGYLYEFRKGALEWE